MTIVTVRRTQERGPDVLVEFHKTFKGMNMNSQRYHMSTIVERVRPNHLVDHINQLPLKVSCAVIVKQRASLETYLKVCQSPEIPYANHPSDQTICFMVLYEPLTIQGKLWGYCYTVARFRYRLNSTTGTWMS